MPLSSPDTAPSSDSTKPGIGSGFAPLKIPLFRDRWIASTISSVGTWMQDTAGTWLMTVIASGSPLLIALMQTAASLPVLLLGLLAGATADIFDRRKLLIFWQAWMLVAVALLTLFTFLGHISPWALLAFTFLLNTGSAMNNPGLAGHRARARPARPHPGHRLAQRRLQQPRPRRRPRPRRPHGRRVLLRPSREQAASSRSTRVSFAGVIWVLVNWRRTPLFKSALPTERISGSIRGGLRYVRHSPQLQSSLLRAFTYCFFVSSIWALLAVVARRDLHQGARSATASSTAHSALEPSSPPPSSRASARRATATQILFISTLYQAGVMLRPRLRPHPLHHHPHIARLGFHMDGNHVHHQHLRPAVRAALGHRPRPRHLPHDLPGRHGPRRHPLGLSRRTLLSTPYSPSPSPPAGLARERCPSPTASKSCQGPTPDFTPYQYKRPSPRARRYRPRPRARPPRRARPRLHRVPDPPRLLPRLHPRHP